MAQETSSNNSCDKSNQTDNDCAIILLASTCKNEVEDSGESRETTVKPKVVDASQQCCIIDSLPRRTARNATRHICEALKQQMRSNSHMRHNLDALLLGGTRRCAINIHCRPEWAPSESDEMDANCAPHDLNKTKKTKKSSTLELEMSFTIVRQKDDKESKNCRICREIKDESRPGISSLETKFLGEDEQLLLETKEENNFGQKVDDESKKKKSKLRRNHINIREKSIEMKLIDALRRQIEASLPAKNQDEVLKILEEKCDINLAALDEAGKTPLIIYAIKAKCVELTSICLKYLNECSAATNINELVDKVTGNSILHQLILEMPQEEQLFALALQQMERLESIANHKQQTVQQLLSEKFKKDLENQRLYESLKRAIDKVQIGRRAKRFMRRQVSCTTAAIN